MRRDLQALAGILNFIIPFEVVSAIGLVFALENIVEAYVTTGTIPMIWVQVYVVFIVLVGVVRLATADEEEMEELEDDFDELRD